MTDPRNKRQQRKSEPRYNTAIDRLYARLGDAAPEILKRPGPRPELNAIDRLYMRGGQAVTDVGNWLRGLLPPPSEPEPDHPSILMAEMTPEQMRRAIQKRRGP